MRLSLSKKIIITIETIVLITIVLLGFVFFIFLQNNTKNEIDTRLNSISYLKENYINQYLDFYVSSVETTVRSMHINTEFINFLQKKDLKSGEKVKMLLMDEMINTSELIDFYVMDTNGVVVLSNNNEEEGKIRTNESYFIDAKEKTNINNFVYDTSSKKIITIIATPIKDNNSNLIGVFAAEIKVDKIAILMADRLGLGNTGETYIINKSHIVITTLLKEKDAKLTKTIYLSPVNRCLNNDSNYYLSNDYYGDKVYGYARWIPEIDSCLVTKIDYNEVMSPIFSLIPQIVVIIIIIIIVVLIFGFIIGESIIKPLRILRDNAIKIKEGDLNVLIESKSNDEIGDLAIAFKDMFVKLKDLYNTLEDKVKERTFELEDSEKRLEKTLEISELNNKMMIGRELEMIKLKEQINELKKNIK